MENFLTKFSKIKQTAKTVRSYDRRV